MRTLTVVIFLLAFCAGAHAIDVKYDYDHHVDFGRYKTYSWAKVDMPDSLWNDRVQEAIDKALSAKGWTRVPDGGDASIMAMGITKEKPTLHTFYDGWDGWIWGGFGHETTEIENYTVGTLVVDIFDNSTKKLIWRGSASDVLSDRPEKNIEKVNKATEKMFEHFPPPNKG
jgi:hypothetical protein